MKFRIPIFGHLGPKNPTLGPNLDNLMTKYHQNNLLTSARIVESTYKPSLSLIEESLFFDHFFGKFWPLGPIFEAQFGQLTA